MSAKFPRGGGGGGGGGAGPFLARSLISVIPITQLRMRVIKIVTFKGGHLIVEKESFNTIRNCY